MGGGDARHMAAKAFSIYSNDKKKKRLTCEGNTQKNSS
jgi:hypothetical protein